MSIIQIPLNSPSFKSLHTPSSPLPYTCQSNTFYSATRIDQEAQEIFSPPKKDFGDWFNTPFLPLPYDESPAKRLCFSPKKAEDEVYPEMEETSAPTSESSTLLLSSPTKNTAAVPDVNPKTPQGQKRKRAFTENSPSTPLLSPEAREKFGKIASPLWTHDASNFNKKARNSKEKMKFKQEIKKLAKKPVHTFEVGSPTKSSAIQTTPDKEGRLKHKGRYLRLHEPAVDTKDPTVKKPNRIIPAIGPFCIRQPGNMSEQMVTDYQNSPINETFTEFLTRECPRVFTSLHPRSAQTLETTGLDFVEP